MRDRGITAASANARMMAAVTGGLLLATLWAWTGAPPEAGSAKMVTRNLGAVLLVVTALTTANYLYAAALARKLRRGEGVIAGWTVPQAEFERFRTEERAMTKRKNNWRMPRGGTRSGLPVIFGRDCVLVGDTYFKLLGKGISRFASVRIEQGATPSVEFAMRLTAYGSVGLGQTARYRGHLRVPIAPGASVEAARVVRHFEDVLEGRAKL
ncbi:hypothetical protein G7076_01225 [Sphingomonas sp. HDW15A]|uniref:hypothetical protein n=1 Tax=Sphingomonas sp. HDW15A TaxID=2714942 RepID=UPI0014094047|nr:hypothetical protein [Sphingomonas sp. HDW15A]QIK95288.1 hypothetical protein G7076_01225 [Sphingomonas sp. HDW15A]